MGYLRIISKNNYLNLFTLNLITDNKKEFRMIYEINFHISSLQQIVSQNDFCFRGKYCLLYMVFNNLTFFDILKTPLL